MRKCKLVPLCAEFSEAIRLRVKGALAAFVFAFANVEVVGPLVYLGVILFPLQMTWLAGWRWLPKRKASLGISEGGRWEREELLVNNY